ncbi:MAG: hypothetical protein WKF83_12545 [Nocardioidaceae bacterium]
MSTTARTDSKADHHDRDPAQQRPHLTEGPGVQVGLGDQAGTQSQASADQQAEDGGEGHDPEAADLHQQQDHRLPERRPERRGVDGGSTRSR